MRNERNVSRRFTIAMIYFLIAIILAIVECIIIKKLIYLEFFNIIGSTVVYSIYYVLISTAIEDYKIWPLVVLFLICYICVCITNYKLGDINIICEVLEIILFVSQIITAVIIKAKYSKKVTRYTI